MLAVSIQIYTQSCEIFERLGSGFNVIKTLSWQVY